jgi:hypothetical protein
MMLMCYSALKLPLSHKFLLQLNTVLNILRTKSGACTSSSPLRVASVVNAIAKCPQKNMV